MTRRATVSPVISHALVEKGNDAVVTSLLKNERAEIAPATYDAVVRRAEASPVLQAPLVRRSTVPIELLNGLYMKVEGDLRKEIVAKFEAVSPDELEKAFQRSRDRVSNVYKQMPDDFEPSNQRINQMERRGGLTPPILISLLREGRDSRTAFKLAFARLTDVEFELIERVVEHFDLDTVALLCRGSNFDKALFVSLGGGAGRSCPRPWPAPKQFGKLYEGVPVQAAQRAIRFWKVRAAA